MSTIFFVTHPEVVVEPLRPVPRWGLSETGVARMQIFAASAEVQDVRSVWASDETKAVEAAGIFAVAHGLPVAVDPRLHENDRSATGFLPPAEFEQTANEFFAKPNESIRGWERAADAQSRIVAAFENIAAIGVPGDIMIVAHGGVGTLLLCQLSGEPIDRKHDQPFQGNYWAFSLQSRKVLHAWRPIAPR